MFRLKRKHHIFRKEKEIPSSQILQKRSYSSAIFSEKTIFSEHLKKTLYFLFFFFLERLSFLFRLKIIFSEKRNMIFPDNTRKIIFQCDIFEKTIFSENLEIEKMVFRAVYFVLFYSLI